MPQYQEANNVIFSVNSPAILKKEQKRIVGLFSLMKHRSGISWLNISDTIMRIVDQNAPLTNRMKQLGKGAGIKRRCSLRGKYNIGPFS